MMEALREKRGERSGLRPSRASLLSEPGEGGE